MPIFQLAQQQRQQQQAAPGNAPNPLAGVLGAGGTPGTIDLAALRDNPQVQQWRELITQNPAMLQPLIQQLAASNPGLAQAFAQNPEALLQLLGSEGGDYEGEGGEPVPPGAHVVHVSEEEQAAIQRVGLSIIVVLVTRER